MVAAAIRPAGAAAMAVTMMAVTAIAGAVIMIVMMTITVAGDRARPPARGPAAKRLVHGTVQGEKEVSRPWSMGCRGESEVSLRS